MTRATVWAITPNGSIPARLRLVDATGAPIAYSDTDAIATDRSGRIVLADTGIDQDAPTIYAYSITASGVAASLTRHHTMRGRIGAQRYRSRLRRGDHRPRRRRLPHRQGELLDTLQLELRDRAATVFEVGPRSVSAAPRSGQLHHPI